MVDRSGYTQILVGFERVGNRPLELNTLFDTYSEALDYARNNPTSYVGQILSVNEKVYVITNVDGIKSLDRIVTSDFNTDLRSTKYIYTNVDNITFRHNLGYNPEVIFTDKNGVRLYPLIEYPDTNTIKISWNGSRTGSFYLI